MSLNLKLIILAGSIFGTLVAVHPGLLVPFRLNFGARTHVTQCITFKCTSLSGHVGTCSSLLNLTTRLSPINNGAKSRTFAACVDSEHNRK